MARVTVEDCIAVVPNRFELVVLAAERTRQIFAGAPLKVERRNDKNPVVALREIAEGELNVENLEEATIQSYRTHIELDEKELEMAEMLSAEQDISEREIEIGSADDEGLVSLEEALEAEDAMEEAWLEEDE